MLKERTFKLILILTLIITMICTACSDDNSENETSSARFIDTDGGVVSIKSVKVGAVEEKVSEDTVLDEKYKTAYEIKIAESGEPNSQYSGNDVEYNGVVYRNIVEQISSIEKPCSTDGMIKFITENFDAKQNEVFVRAEEITADSNLITEIQCLNRYSEIENRYSAVPKYMITVYEYGMSRYVTLYTCEKYIIAVDTGEDLSVEYTWDSENEEEIDSEESIEETSN